MGLLTTCHNCGHEWFYRGSKDPGETVTCPSCKYKTDLPEEQTA